MSGCGGGGGNGSTGGEEVEQLLDIGKVEPLDASKIVTDPATGQEVVNDQILITFKEGVSESTVNAKIASINGEIVGYIKGMNDYQVRIKGNPTLAQLKALVEQLNNDPDVESASLNTIQQINKIPNDPQWNDTWDEGEPNGRNWGLEAINALSAWDYNDSMGSVTNGVVDGGFNISHEDLSLSSNNANGANSRYYAIESDAPDCGFWDGLLGKPCYKDYNNHGTHVAGTIGALSDNSKGVTGILWKRGLIIYRTDFQDFDIKYAIVWELEKGAKVINLSLGKYAKKALGRNPSDSNQEDIKTYIEIPKRYWAAFMKKLVAKYDFLIVQAAGNENIDAKWSGGFNSIDDENLRKRIITVGAIKLGWWSWLPWHYSYEMAELSNYGFKVDIVAPGEDIYSTFYYDPYYGSMSGTSMAAPHVTGVAALVWAINPNLTAQQVKEIVVGTADRPVTYKGHQYKIVNAKASVERAKSEQATQPISQPPTGVLIGKVQDAKSSNPIEGAQVSALKSGSYYASTVSQSDGSYELVLEVGIYTLTVGKDGYIPENITVTVAEGVTTYIATLRSVPSENSGDGTIEGYITNAFTGQGVSGLTIKFRRGIDIVTGDVVKTIITGTNGFYSITLPAGNYTGEITGSGYATGYFLVVSIGGQTTPNQNGSVTPILSPGETRIILTWGETPWDLDSHLTGPLPDGTRFHMYFPYAEKNDGSPWPEYVKLDLDDVTSYGPETTTIYQQISGIYRFSVHDYTNRNSSNSYALSNSGAQVRVYRGSNLVATFNVPPNQEGTLWTVFEMDGNTITPINTMSYVSQPISVQRVYRDKSYNTDEQLLRNLPLKR